MQSMIRDSAEAAIGGGKRKRNHPHSTIEEQRGKMRLTKILPEDDRIASSLSFADLSLSSRHLLHFLRFHAALEFVSE